MERQTWYNLGVMERQKNQSIFHNFIMRTYSTYRYKELIIHPLTSNEKFLSGNIIEFLDIISGITEHIKAAVMVKKHQLSYLK